MMFLIIACIITSLIGLIGLTQCPPRPRAQETWAIVTVAPIIALVCLAMIGGR